jgi:uncharacterized metal-binding protein YceD (DUF177 family)
VPAEANAATRLAGKRAERRRVDVEAVQQARYRRPLQVQGDVSSDRDLTPVGLEVTSEMAVADDQIHVGDVELTIVECDPAGKSIQRHLACVDPVGMDLEVEVDAVPAGGVERLVGQDLGRGGFLLCLRDLAP